MEVGREGGLRERGREFSSDYLQTAQTWANAGVVVL